MKALTILALLVALGGVGASLFAKVETYPNYQSLSQQLAAEGPSTQYDVPLLADYAGTIKLMHYIAFGAAALSLVLGLLAHKKTREGKIRTPLPMMAIVIGLIGAGLTVLSAPPWV